MNRLVQGDVGSGKTMVALLAMVVALENGYQAAFMAPTEILAEQHFLTFRRLLARCALRVELLTAAVQGQGARGGAGRALASGEAQIAVGTHALIQEGVDFQRLGLAVVDEQHRFGVLQRDDLPAEGLRRGRAGDDRHPDPAHARPHRLRRPRRLARRRAAARPHADRHPAAHGLRPARGASSWCGARSRAGRQAYVVYPLVEESEKLEDVRAATEMAEEWQAALPGRAGRPAARPAEARGEGRR